MKATTSRPHPSQRRWWRLSLLLPFLLLAWWWPMSELHPCLQTMIDNPVEQEYPRYSNSGTTIRHPSLQPLADALKFFGLPRDWLYHDRAEPAPFFTALKRLNEEKGGWIRYPVHDSHGLPASFSIPSGMTDIREIRAWAERQMAARRLLLVKDQPTGEEYFQFHCIDGEFSSGYAVKASDGKHSCVVVMLRKEERFGLLGSWGWLLLLYDPRGHCLHLMYLADGVRYENHWTLSETILVNQLPSNGGTLFEIPFGRFVAKARSKTNKVDWEFVEKERHKIIIRHGRFVDLLQQPECGEGNRRHVHDR